MSERVDRAALIEAAQRGMHEKDCGCDYPNDDEFYLRFAVAAVDTVLPLIADAITAACKESPTSQYRDGVIDGYYRSARLVRSYLDGAQ